MSLSSNTIRCVAAVACFAAAVVTVSAAGTLTSDVSAVDGGEADILHLVVYVSLALGCSFLCSVAEAVLLSVTPSYIARIKETHPRRAALLKRLKQDEIDRSLAAILTLNTIAHTVGAIGAGAKATIVFGSAWFGLFSAVMTLAILFLSEIIPKTIGAVYWPRLTGPTALFVRWLIVFLYPLVWLSEKLTRLVARKKPTHLFSRDEFIAMARMGEQTGGIREKESRVIRNLFKFDSLRAVDIMTPRTVIAALSQELAVADALNKLTKSPFSRLLVYRRGLDDVTGFVLKGDALVANAQGRGDETLESLKRPIAAVPEALSLSSLLERFLTDRMQIAIVVDEYGGMSGLVTLEDIVETLVGAEIMDENDDVEDMRALAREKWAARARSLGVDPKAGTD